MLSLRSFLKFTPKDAHGKVERHFMTTKYTLMNHGEVLHENGRVCELVDVLRADSHQRVDVVHLRSSHEFELEPVECGLRGFNGPETVSGANRRR